MKLFLPLFFILATCYLIFNTFVFADFDRAYQDYLYQSDQYRKSLTDFLTAKNRYLTYGTLTSKTEALTSTKTFLDARDQVLLTYMQMLVERNPQDNLKNLLSDEIHFYSDHKNLIPAVGSLNDCVKVSEKFEEHYPSTEVITRQTVAGLLLAKVQVFDDRLASLSAGFEEKTNLVKGQGKDVTTLERWLLETRNKQLLAQNKLNEAQNLSDKLKPTRSPAQSSENFGQIQVLIFEANQYLKEGAAYLKEIKEELKYGNY